MLLLNKPGCPNNDEQAEDHRKDARHQKVGNECHGGFVAEREGQSGRTHGKYLYAFWDDIPLKSFKQTMLHPRQPCINTEY